VEIRPEVILEEVIKEDVAAISNVFLVGQQEYVFIIEYVDFDETESIRVPLNMIAFSSPMTEAKWRDLFRELVKGLKYGT